VSGKSLDFNRAENDWKISFYVRTVLFCAARYSAIWFTFAQMKEVEKVPHGSARVV
jgi:hypothetical protein